MPEILHSFDLFDTCITRMHAYPRDLFFDLGLQLAPVGASESRRRHFAKRFQRARIRGEKIANWRARQRGGEHADIHAIYSHVGWLMRLTLQLEELVAAELALEERSLYPIPETLKYIETRRTSGQRIVFISDMYIPSKLLQPILKRKGIMHEGDVLYVSCDMGCSKHSGRLFDLVLAQEGVQPKDMSHMGDNEHADIRMAQARGIHTRFFTAAHLLELESSIAGPNIPRVPAASWQAAFSRRCRLMSWHEKDQATFHPLDGVIFGLVVPFLLIYVQWVLDDARRRGLARLYFVARDGEVLFKVAKALKPESIALRYLYGSRRAWLAPSITLGQDEWKRLLVIAGSANAPFDIACRAGLDIDQHDKLMSAFGMNEIQWRQQLDMLDAKNFVDNLTAIPSVKDLLRISTDDKRELALMYFSQEGLLDGTSWALVDSGWSLNGQAALMRILKNAEKGLQKLPQGYYIGLALDHLSSTITGNAFPFLSYPGSIFSRRRVVVEHCFLPSTHASTQGYKRVGETAVPEFSDEVRSDIEIAYAQRLHAVACHAASLVAQSSEIRDCLRRFTPSISETASRFISHPDPTAAHLLSSFSAIADMRQEQAFAQSLCRPLRFGDVWRIISMALSKSTTFKSDAWMWMEGSAALSSVHMRLPVQLMLWVDRMKNKLIGRN